eukprot:scaffold6767_cov108-Skeletonema_marinoi.AAC.4
MGACDVAKVILHVRSILWDLGIPQEAEHFSTKTMMPPPQWRMPKNLRHALDTWTFDSLLFLNG